MKQFQDGSVQWIVRFFCPEDAHGVVALYREIYGDNFPFTAVYDPAFHVAQFHSRDSSRSNGSATSPEHPQCRMAKPSVPSRLNH